MKFRKPQLTKQEIAVLLAIALLSIAVSLIIFNIFTVIFLDLMPNKEFSKLFEPVLTSKFRILLIIAIIMISVGDTLREYVAEIEKITEQISSSKLQFLQTYISTTAIIGYFVYLSKNASDTITFGILILIIVILRGASRVMTYLEKQDWMFFKLILEIFFKALEISEITAVALFFTSIGVLILIVYKFSIIPLIGGISLIVASSLGLALNILPEKWIQKLNHKVNKTSKIRQKMHQKNKNKQEQKNKQDENAIQH